MVGIERVLFRVVSMDNGCELCTPEPIPWLPHSYELPWFVMPMRLDALAGGVGKVCARSSAGRPACEPILCGG